MKNVYMKDNWYDGEKHERKISTRKANKTVVECFKSNISTEKNLFIDRWQHNMVKWI